MPANNFNGKNLQSSVKNIVKRSIVTLPGTDDGIRSGAQVSYMGNTANIETIYPYGFYANAPAGSNAILLNVQAEEENRVGFVYDVVARFKGLKTGEVYVGNPITQAVIKFLADGSIEITTTANINVISPLTTVTGDATVTSNVNLAGTGGPGVARIGDLVDLGTGEITGGSTKVFAN